MPFLAGLLLSLLQLAAFLFLWVACGRDRYAFGNPWSFAFARLTSACVGTVRSAIPLPPRALCIVLAALALVCRATLLARFGESALPLGAFQFVRLLPSGFLGWCSVALLQFFGFLLSLWTGCLFLRIWHGAHSLPGALGDLVRQVTWPFSMFRVSAQLMAVFALSVLYVRLCLAFPGEYHDLLHQVISSMELPVSLKTFPSGLVSEWGIAVFSAGSMIITVTAAFAGYLEVLILFSLLTLLFRNPAMTVFLGEAFALLCGRLPVLRIGPISLTPIVAYLAFHLISAVGIGVWLGIFAAVNRVV